MIKKVMSYALTPVLIWGLMVGGAMAQDVKVSEDIRLNQVGFYPKAPKIAVVVNTTSDVFFVTSPSGKDTVFTGKLKKAGTWEYSGEVVSQADFTKFERTGDYRLCIPDKGNSYIFNIQPRVHFEVSKAGVKAFYYQRASMALDPVYAGKWARKAGHPDTAVVIHNSAASASRAAGTKISSPRGWYDAGDYNKYIVNSGISTYTLMALYESFPTYFDTLHLNIPESKNALPDLLDEVLWNLRWMLSMQDQEDGGVYFKLTNANFDGMELPEKTVRARYVVMKTTTSALDFAAVTAQAARIFLKFKGAAPGLADSCLKASEKAYAWAQKNSDLPYKQAELHDPKINTGEYGDHNFKDEFQWAATELFVTTGKKNYYNDADVETLANTTVGIPSWADVSTLGLYSLSKHRKTIKEKYKVDVEFVAQAIVSRAEEIKNYTGESPYAIPMGIEAGNFVWGSNATNSNIGMLMLEAFKVKNDKKFLDVAIAALDYILGRNATGYSFVSGHGDKPIMHPHHRPSEGDGILEPIPGLLSGGPNPGHQDKLHCNVKYPSDLPAKSFLDHSCSYASNEIAINWNAPFAFLSFGIEALKSGE